METWVPNKRPFHLSRNYLKLTPLTQECFTKADAPIRHLTASTGDLGAKPTNFLQRLPPAGPRWPDKSHSTSAGGGRPVKRPSPCAAKHTAKQTNTPSPSAALSLSRSESARGPHRNNLTCLAHLRLFDQPFDSSLSAMECCSEINTPLFLDLPHSTHRTP